MLEEAPCIRHFREARETKKRRKERCNFAHNTIESDLYKKKENPNRQKRTLLIDISGFLFFGGTITSALIGWFALTNIFNPNNRQSPAAAMQTSLTAGFFAVSFFLISLLQLWIICEHKKIKRFIYRKAIIPMLKIKRKLPLKITIELGR
jgi:hypothetical protein